MISIRRAQQTDLESILKIQASGYDPVYHEPKETFEAMMKAYPVGCLVAEDNQNTIYGYLFMHPYLQNQIQKLNSRSIEIPENFDCIYFHDLCVDLSRRNMGVADLLAKEGIKLAINNSLQIITFVAVNGSHTYFEKKGFNVVRKLENYGGKSAYFMKMNIKN
jgi:predicted N-acetyltransferase YhbS